MAGTKLQRLFLGPIHPTRTIAVEAATSLLITPIAAMLPWIILLLVDAGRNHEVQQKKKVRDRDGLGVSPEVDRSKDDGLLPKGKISPIRNLSPPR